MAPVKSFAANAYGLYDVAGNGPVKGVDVPTGTAPDYYAQMGAKKLENPAEPAASYDPDEPTVPKRVVRGGSFCAMRLIASATARVGPDGNFTRYRS